MIIKSCSFDDFVKHGLDHGTISWHHLTLKHKHRRTLKPIFRKPVSVNLRWEEAVTINSQYSIDNIQPLGGGENYFIRCQILLWEYKIMKQINPFRVVLSDASWDQTEQLEHFALLNLGIVESLASGVLSATEAIQRFYHADNCLYVRKHLRNNQANAIMSHGVQLPDIFDCLPTEEAQREFLYELEMIRSLCLKLLDKGRSSRVANRATG